MQALDQPVLGVELLYRCPPAICPAGRRRVQAATIPTGYKHKEWEGWEADFEGRVLIDR